MATLPVRIDASGSVLGAQVHNRSMRSMQRVTRETQGVMKRFLGVMAGIAVFKAAAKAIAEFELTMRKVQGVTGQTTAEMKKMTAVARELGATTMFSATEAGEGLLFLSRAGFTAEESMTALSSTLNLAAASGMELGASADLASNVLRQFGLEADETTRVVDALVRVSNQANTDVTQLGQAMKFAGPIAGALGKSVEETAVLIGLLGDSGIQASQAGTNLRGVMLALASPTEGAQKAMRELGLSMHNLNPATNSMSKIFAQFEKAGLSAAQAAEIFGRRNAAAALILAAANKSIDANQEKLQDMNDALSIAEMNADTLAGAFKNLISAVQEMFLAAGDNGLGGALRNIVDLMTSVFRSISGMEIAVEKNTTVVKILVFGLQSLAASLVALLALKVAAMFAAMARSIWLAVVAQRALNLAMITNPIGLIAVGVGVAVVALSRLDEKLIKATSSALAMQRSLGEFADKPLRDIDSFGEDFAGKVDEAEKAVARMKVIIGSIIGTGTEAPGTTEKLIRDITGQRVDEFNLRTSQGRLVPPVPTGPGSLGAQTLRGTAFDKSGLQVQMRDVRKAAEERLKVMEFQLAQAREQKVAADKRRDAELEELKPGSRTSIIAGINEQTEKLKEQTQILIDNEASFAALNQAKMANKVITSAGLDASQEFSERTKEEQAIVFAIRLAIEKLAEARDENNKIQKENAIAEFNAALDFEIAMLGKTADEVERLTFWQDAHNFAVRNSIENAEEFANKQEAKLATFQAERNALQEAEAAWVQWENVASNALNSVIDGLLDIVIEGQNAADVIENLIKSIGRMVAKQVITQAVTSIVSGSADGNLLQGGHVVNRFARGGLLVNSPVVSPVGMNLLGESGPEFVLPAVRGSDGKLGVRMNGVGGQGGTQNNNQRLSITNNFFDKARDVDSFRRSTRQQRRDAKEALRG